MPGSQLIQSLLRGLDILDALADRPAGMALRDVAGALEVAPSTAHNLLRTLAARGFVEKDGAVYRAGPQIERLHRRTQSRAYLEACDRELLDLSSAYPGAIFIYGEPRGADLVSIRRVSPANPGVVERPFSRAFAPYNSISSLVYQAFADAETVALMRLEHPFSEQGAHLWDNPESVEDFLEDVRRRGYGISPFEPKTGFLRLAVPVVRADGALLGAIGASIPEPQSDVQTTEEQLAQRVRESAARIGAA